MQDKENEELKDWEADPIYSNEDDIFKKGKNIDVDPDDIGKLRKEKIVIEKERSDMDEGLDVPGADLDDEDEFIGEEDEENNYYSLGGDDHDDLEEEDNS